MLLLHLPGTTNNFVKFLPNLWIFSRCPLISNRHRLCSIILIHGKSEFIIFKFLHIVNVLLNYFGPFVNPKMLLGFEITCLNRILLRPEVLEIRAIIFLSDSHFFLRSARTLRIQTGVSWFISAFLINFIVSFFVNARRFRWFSGLKSFWVFGV